MKSFPGISNGSFRRLIAFAAAAGVLNLSAWGVLASTRSSAESLGMLTVSGVVTVNDVPALSGLTVSSGSHIVTSSGASSVLELGKQTRLVLSEQTELALDFSAAGISGSLEKGALNLFIPVNRGLTLTTPAGVVATDLNQTAVVNIRVENGGTRVSVAQGRVELRSGKSTRSLSAGESLSTLGDSSTPPPQQNLSQAKRIGIIAGIGGGLAILLIALTLGDAEPDFGGCVITLSPIDPQPPCS